MPTTDDDLNEWEGESHYHEDGFAGSASTDDNPIVPLLLILILVGFAGIILTHIFL